MSFVKTAKAEELGEGLTELRERVRAFATEPGRRVLAHPDAWVFRSDEPLAKSQLESPGILVAVIADRRKHVQFRDGQRFAYQPGEFLCCTRATHYHSRVPEASPRRPYLAFGIHLQPELVAETVLALDGDDPHDAANDVDGWVGSLDAPLLDSFLRLLRALDDSVEARLVAPLIIREVVVRLLRSDLAAALRAAARTDDGRIRRAMEYIRDNSHETLSVAAVAREVGMSPSHFAHRFREVARMSPMRYAKQQRLLRARTLLLGDRRVSEVAHEVGYASPAQFTRDFKASYGAPPLDFARRYRTAAE